MASKEQISELQRARAGFKPVLPAIFKSGPAGARVRAGAATRSISDQAAVRKTFPQTYGLPVVSFAAGNNAAVSARPVTVGVVLSGGQAPGGHNVIAGLHDALKKANPRNRLIGFLGGPSGILEAKFKEITGPLVDAYRNTGGFDMIQSGRTKIETPEQFEKAKRTLMDARVNALVVVGGDDSNTNAGLLAEYFKAGNTGICVIGVPKTIDGDLKNSHIEASFGFDTATKIYAEMVGNICRDVNSARKYWHFIRLMGRSASHITLEVGFKTRPNIVLVGEEVLAKKMTLAQVVGGIAEVAARRAAAGKNFGVILVPEGLIEFIPEMKELIASLNDVMAEHEEAINGLADAGDKTRFVSGKLSLKLAALMRSLPEEISSQLMLDRDPHGNVQVSQIETEKLLADMVKAELAKWKKAGTFAGKFSAITHFMGYEGRCGAPSNFDANYTYALGYTAAVLSLNGLTGYLSSVRHLTRPAARWECGGVPLTMMMNMERRKGKEKPVIQKALVVLNGAPFRFYEKNRAAWSASESYLFPGPIQYFGPCEVTDLTTRTLAIEQAGKK